MFEFVTWILMILFLPLNNLLKLFEIHIVDEVIIKMPVSELNLFLSADFPNHVLFKHHVFNNNTVSGGEVAFIFCVRFLAGLISRIFDRMISGSLDQFFNLLNLRIIQLAVFCH